jgi:hypothetical protein
MAKKKPYGGRALLNLPGHETVGAIVAEVENTEHVKKPADEYDYVREPTMNLAISDCSRSIGLAVSVRTADDYKNTLHKVDTMIELLEGFREGVVAERERFVERKKQHAKNKKRKK